MPELLSQEWLLIEWPEGEAAPTKYWLSTLPANISFRELVDFAKLRWQHRGTIGRAPTLGKGLKRERLSDEGADDRFWRKADSCLGHPVNFVAFDLSGAPHSARVPDNIDSKIVF
jgi:hypothetical protein